MSHKQAKRIRQQLKNVKAYQSASPVVSYEKTNLRRHAFTSIQHENKTYITSTDVTEKHTQRGMYRRIKGQFKMKMFDGLGIA